MDGEDGRPGDPGEPGTPGEVAYFTDPGLVLTLSGAGVSPTGTATVGFRITDRGGLPLDRQGRFTQGAVSLNFVLAVLDRDRDGRPNQYHAFTTREQTSPITGRTERQAASENGGSFESLGDGRYRYTFVATATGSLARRFTVGVYASRTVAEARAVANATLDFSPGGAPIGTRELVTEAACNRCHGALSAHGGGRTSLELCVLCHTQQTVDPDTGNTVDMMVMIHKIHMGRHLPSVIGGTPYQIIGFRQSVDDYSTVAYPAELTNCAKCHEGADAALHAERPNTAACTSCHDRTSITDPPPPGFVIHPGGPQPDENCNVCHLPRGGIAGIFDTHLTPLSDPARTHVTFQLVSVRNAAPGSAPTVRFGVQVDGAPRDLLAQPLTSLRLTFAGPNSDYAHYWQTTMQGSGASGTLVAVSPGLYDYTPSARGAIPAFARGSYTVGMEGYLQAGSAAPRFAGVNPVMPFLVTGTATVARRTTINSASCENCHVEVRAHGDQRLNPQYCTLCHNANNPNDERAARVEGASIFIESTDLKYMIHKIHRGEDLTRPFVLYGFPAPSVANPSGTPVDFGEVRFPGIRGDCSACHAGPTYEPPLGAGLLPSLLQQRTCTEPVDRDTDAFCNNPYYTITSTTYLPPTTAACVGCHDDDATMVHAEVNTTSSGREACAVCHGPGGAQDVERVHPIRR